MKRYIIALALIMVAAVVCAAPGDKRPAVTSAAIGLGATSSATMGSVTATTSVTAPAFNSSAADGYHYILPYNSTAFAGTPLRLQFSGLRFSHRKVIDHGGRGALGHIARANLGKNLGDKIGSGLGRRNSRRHVVV